MAEVKIRHLPDGNSKIQGNDLLVLAQSWGGHHTRKVSAGEFVKKMIHEGEGIYIDNNIISIDQHTRNRIFDNEVGIHRLLGDVADLKQWREDQASVTPVQHAYVNTSHLYASGSTAGITGAIVNVAKNLYHSLPSGSTIDILWRRYWTYRGGNGTSSAQTWLLSRYIKGVGRNGWVNQSSKVTSTAHGHYSAKDKSGRV